MEDQQIRTAVGVVLRASAVTLSEEQCRKLLIGTVLLRKWLDGVDNQVVERLNELAAQAAPAGRPATTNPAVAGALTGCRSSRDAKAAIARAKTGQAIPALGAALNQGVISGAHVDAVGKAAASLVGAERADFESKGSELLEAAKSMSPDELLDYAKDRARAVQIDHGVEQAERCRRDRRITQFKNWETQMNHTTFVLDDENHAILWGAINQIIDTARSNRQDGDERTWDQFRVDAVVHHLAASSAIDTTGRTLHPEVTVLVDARTLVDGPHAETVCEYSDGTPVPVSTVRRYCCDATMYHAVLNDEGVVLNLGLTQRLANRDQRRALRAMYSTCVHPDCTVPVDRCRAHHVRFWSHDGPTDLANLAPVCDLHHGLVHEGGWTLRIVDAGARRIVQWYRPDGSLCDVTHPDRRKRLVTVPPAESPSPPPSRPRPQGRDLGDPFPQEPLFGTAC